MRISSLYNSNAMLSQLGTNGNRVAKLMEQLSSQKRVNVPSDDPVAASRLVQLGREQAAIKQYQSNITSLSGALSVQEGVRACDEATRRAEAAAVQANPCGM